MSQKKLVIIHGWTYTIEPWTKTVDLLRRRGVEVEQLRVPGLTQDSSRVWTIDDYVKWLDKELADKPEATVLGHSNGGRIALNYAIKYPNKLSHLILLNSAGIYYQPTSLSWRRQLGRFLTKIGKPLAKIVILRKVFYRFLDSDYEKAPENMKKTLHNMLESDKTFDPSKVKVGKIDILWGEADKTTPLAMGKQLQTALPGSTWRQFTDWGHAPYIEQPEELAEAILEVL